MMVSSAPAMSSMAIWGFILAFLCALPGLILSIVALNQINRSMGMLRGRGLAIAGIVISIIVMIGGVSMRSCGRSYRRAVYRSLRVEAPTLRDHRVSQEAHARLVLANHALTTS